MKDGVTREIEDEERTREVWRGRRGGAVPSSALAALKERVRTARLRLPDPAPRPAAARPRELAAWLSFAGLRRTLLRAHGVRWWTVPAPPLVAHADARWLEAALAPDTGTDPGGVAPVLLRVLAAALRIFPRALRGDRPRRPWAVAPAPAGVDLGVALYTVGGLRIPVLRDADRKSACQLELELAAAAHRARSGQAVARQPCAAVFCDLGALGRDELPSQLLAGQRLVLGAAAPRTERRRGRSPRHVLPLVLAIGPDGPERGEAGRLLRWLARALEDPRLLALAR